ncbi:uncharacterized protein ELE39_000559 [Cryptosporidium sp. chipmunk genotype I]|uniref:uncharacterized protein n=1 Tax=Cryptosporidium sp. chipmunk genotype I TaxID=1280935 RepID=UPI00351A4D48|nr:hypothetical protein ELE39_000559 [Cryptosporidium sp. chipmunk genotype I]
MNSESFDNADLTVSNMSEISCGGSLCLSTKEQYKVINRNQLTKLDFPLFRAGTTSIECGMSLMEEISDIEDECENPFENMSKREKIKKLIGEIKDKSKKRYFNLKESISKIGMKIKMKIASVKESRNNDNNKSTSKLTSSCSNIVKSKPSLSLSKLKSLSRTKMISTSRRAKIHRKVSQVSNKASYKLNTRFSYISKRCISASSTIKSKIVYNCYKLRNIIGNKFPRKSSKFVLSFKKSSGNIERKTMNCNYIPSNELIYDSVEYISRNADDDIEEIQIITNEIYHSNLNTVQELEPNNVSLNENYDTEKQVSDEKSLNSDLQFGENNNSSNNNHIEIDLIKNEFSQFENNIEVDDTTPTTTIDSFLRLSSMDSTTCTTIQNDTNSNTPFPIILSVGKVMEQMESLYQELIQLKNNNIEILSGNKELNSTNTLPFGKDDMEIFSSMKELANNLNKEKEKEGGAEEKEKIFKKNDSDEEFIDNSLSNSNTIFKQNQFRYDLVFTLLRQTLQYYENIKNSYLDSELKVKPNDNEQIKHLIISAIQKLKSSGNMHALEV